MKVTAYKVAPGLTLEPAPLAREWQQDTPDGFAQRCLPMLIANQAGWILRNTFAFTVTHNGGKDAADTTIEFDGGPKMGVMSHFGSGIITWSIPYLFRTEPGVHLWVRGPSNYPKDGVYPLEGIVETDWATQTFTMNWMITRPNHPIRFEENEPICMLTLVRLSDLDNSQPETTMLSNAPLETQKAFIAYRDSRAIFNVRLHDPDSKERMQKWEKHYFKGKHHNNAPAEQPHRTRLHLKPFEEK